MAAALAGSCLGIVIHNFEKLSIAHLADAWYNIGKDIIVQKGGADAGGTGQYI